MSAKFFRLYRAIADEGANQTICATDNTCLFEQERREALDSLGFKVGYKGEIVLTRNKHHGKLARNKVNMKSRKATAEDQGADLTQWKKDYHIKLQEINKYQSLALEMKEALLDNKKVPNSLWKKFEGPRSSSDNKGEKKNLHGRSNNGITPDSELPNLLYTPIRDIQNEDYESQRREQLTAPTHQWSSHEKRKINDLYWEIARPTSKTTIAWNIYYQMFVARFLESFPNHGVAEVRRKIEQMLALRQLKVIGEEEYWKDMMKKPPLNHAHQSQKPHSRNSLHQLPPLIESEKLPVLR